MITGRCAPMNPETLSENIKEIALQLGASLAGIANADAVLQTPSHRGRRKLQQRFRYTSIVVMALVHPASDPELDWWTGRGGTPGNRKIQRISKSLQVWLKREHAMISRMIPYHVEKGGIFLKEASVAAGLGIIGRNNLLITPQYGACTRLGALSLKSEIPPDKPIRFNPCEKCSAPCLAACPQNAFEQGTYNRHACEHQMRRDEADRKNISRRGKTRSVIAYCRACEWACPFMRGGAAEDP